MANVDYAGQIADCCRDGERLGGGLKGTWRCDPNDIRDGGARIDTFVFLPNFCADTVNDFAPERTAIQSVRHFATQRSAWDQTS